MHDCTNQFSLDNERGGNSIAAEKVCQIFPNLSWLVKMDIQSPKICSNILRLKGIFLKWKRHYI